MSPGYIGPIDLANRRTIHPATMRSLFWEIEPERTDPRRGRDEVVEGDRDVDPNRVVGNPWRRMGLHGSRNLERPGTRRDAGDEPETASGAHVGGFRVPPSAGHAGAGSIDAELEKEFWLNRVRVDWGNCGFSVAEEAGNDAVATLLFAPPRFVPTARSMPTGPISPDAVMLTSLHIDPVIAGRGVEEALIAAAVKHLAGRGIKAIESFGCSGGGDDEHDAIPREEMSLTETILHSIDTPRQAHVCNSGALGAINHGAGDVVATRVLINSGFTVVAPHPTHPRLRRELDPALDWAAAVSDALDQLVAAQFYASLSASRSSTKL